MGKNLGTNLDRVLNTEQGTKTLGKSIYERTKVIDGLRKGVLTDSVTAPSSGESFVEYNLDFSNSFSYILTISGRVRINVSNMLHGETYHLITKNAVSNDLEIVCGGDTYSYPQAEIGSRNLFILTRIDKERVLDAYLDIKAISLTNEFLGEEFFGEEFY